MVGGPTFFLVDTKEGHMVLHLHKCNKIAILNMFVHIFVY